MWIVFKFMSWETTGGERETSNAFIVLLSENTDELVESH